MTPTDLPRERSWSPTGIAVAVFLLVIFSILAVPQISDGPGLSGHILQALNNQRQILLATFTMVNDGIEAKDSRLNWPGDLAAAPVDPVTTFSGYLEELVRRDYIKRSDVGKILKMEGVPTYPGTGPVLGAYSPFKIYRVRESDAANCLFSATKNFTFGQPLDPGQPPYPNPHPWLSGSSMPKRCFVIMRKGGDAIPFYNGQSALNKNLGYMPGHSSLEDPGVETRESILEM